MSYYDNMFKNIFTSRLLKVVFLVVFVCFALFLIFILKDEKENESEVNNQEEVDIQSPVSSWDPETASFKEYAQMMKW